MKTADLLTQRLALIVHWYQGMIDPERGMLHYLYLPEQNRFHRENSPIREIASIWNVEMLRAFLQRNDLDSLVANSLQHYERYLVPQDDYLILDPAGLLEPSGIAHSAFMILALLHAPQGDHLNLVEGLADGILHQQRPDGSLKVYFADLPDFGKELYAGEAMLALMETYRQTSNRRFLNSVKQAFRYYDAQYFQRGRVGPDLLVFFANWQSQACRLLHEHLDNGDRQGVANYLFRLHDEIIRQGFYDGIEHHPDRQVSVTVACALEGLNAAYALAVDPLRADRYRRALCTGLDYLLRLQCTAHCTDLERGGFGLTLADRTQRIDITGHAASALMKIIANTISC